MIFELTEHDIRHIILNAETIKDDGLCPDCEGTGWVCRGNKDTEDFMPGRLAQYGDIGEEATCGNCYGIGYVDFK